MSNYYVPTEEQKKRDLAGQVRPRDGQAKFLAAIEDFSRTGVAVRAHSKVKGLYYAIWQDGRESIMDIGDDDGVPAGNVAACFDYRYLEKKF